MPLYYMVYRVDSNSTAANQYEKMDIASGGSSEAKRRVEAKYKGCKINWVVQPSLLKPSVFKG